MSYLPSDDSTKPSLLGVVIGAEGLQVICAKVRGAATSLINVVNINHYVITAHNAGVSIPFESLYLPVTIANYIGGSDLCFTGNTFPSSKVSDSHSHSMLQRLRLTCLSVGQRLTHMAPRVRSATTFGGVLPIHSSILSQGLGVSHFIL